MPRNSFLLKMSKRSILQTSVIVLVAIYTQVLSLFTTLADANFFMITNFSFASPHASGLIPASVLKPSAVTIHPSESFETSRQMVQQTRETGLRFKRRSGKDACFHVFVSHISFTIENISAHLEIKLSRLQHFSKVERCKT